MENRKLRKFRKEYGDVDIIFEKGKTMFLEMQKGMDIRKIEFDDFRGVYVAKLKRKSILLILLLLVAIGFLGYSIQNVKPDIKTFNYQKKMYLHDNVLSLNMSSDAANEDTLVFSIYNGEQQLIPLYNLEPGATLGNIIVEPIDLPEGSYPVKLRVYVNKYGQSFHEDYDVLLVKE